jgi:hypothetical protein
VSNSSKVLGIDPGLKGALAFLYLDGDIAEIEDMPCIGNVVNAYMLANLIEGYGPVKMAVVERAQSMPRQGIAGAFNYGVSYGKILGVLATLHIPITEIASSQWKKKWRLGKDKNLSRKRASDMFPTWADHFNLVKHDGRAEAVLMAMAWITEHPQASKSKRPVRPALD